MHKKSPNHRTLTTYFQISNRLFPDDNARIAFLVCIDAPNTCSLCSLMGGTPVLSNHGSLRNRLVVDNLRGTSQ